MKILKLNIILFFVLSGLSAFGQKKFTGTFTNGYKGAKLSFTLSADGKQVQKFTFDGYWRCGGSTEHIVAGPDRSFPVVDGKVIAIIVDPENGGSSAFRFDLDGIISGKQAKGTFRMSITGLSCDTYKLNWIATSK